MRAIEPAALNAVDETIRNNQYEKGGASGVQATRQPMHATINVRFNLSIDDNKTVPLATLAEVVIQQNI